MSFLDKLLRKQPEIHSRWEDIHLLFPEGSAFLYSTSFDAHAFNLTISEFYDKQVHVLKRIAEGPDFKKFMADLDPVGFGAVMEQTGSPLENLERLHGFLSLFIHSHGHPEAVTRAIQLSHEIEQTLSNGGGIKQLIQHRLAELSEVELNDFIAKDPSLKAIEPSLREFWNEGRPIDYSQIVLPDADLAEAISLMQFDSRSPESLSKAIPAVIRHHQKLLAEAENLDVVSFFLDKQGLSRSMYDGVTVGILENAHEISRLTTKAKTPPLKLSWKNAQDVVIEAFHQCAPEMGEIAARAFEKGWIHAANPNPQEGITINDFSSDLEGNNHSRISIRFDGTLSSIYPLAHEMGHLVHQTLLREAAGNNARGTPHDVITELPSHFAELLVRDVLMQKAQTPREAVAVDDVFLRNSYRSTLWKLARTKTEVDFHQVIDADSGAHSYEELQTIFQKNVEEVGLNKTELRHFSGNVFSQTSPLTVCAYPLAFAAANALYQDFKEDPSAFRQKYLAFQRSPRLQGIKAYEMVLGDRIHDTDYWRDSIKAALPTLEESLDARNRAGLDSWEGYAVRKQIWGWPR